MHLDQSEIEQNCLINTDKTNRHSMNIDDLFDSPNDRIQKFAEAQVHLYGSDVSLQDYFHALDLNMFYDQDCVSKDQPSINPVLDWCVRAFTTASGISQPRKLKTDVLFCPTPYLGRHTEDRFLVRKLLGLAQTGAEILCLLPVDAAIRRELELELATRPGAGKQITFLDPGMPFNSLERAGCVLSPRYCEVVRLLKKRSRFSNRMA